MLRNLINRITGRSSPDPPPPSALWQEEENPDEAGLQYLVNQSRTSFRRVQREEVGYLDNTQSHGHHGYAGSFRGPRGEYIHTAKKIMKS